MELKIDDQCFYATFSSHKKVWIECPECLGSGRLRVILGDDSEVSIACLCCKDGYSESHGKISSRVTAAEVWPVVIRGMEINEGKSTIYKFFHSGGHYHAKEDRLFIDEAEAIACGEKLAADHALELERQIGQKAEANKNWAWHVKYHRRSIRDGEKALEYHRAALAVADKKAKTGKESKDA